MSSRDMTSPIIQSSLSRDTQTKKRNDDVETNDQPSMLSRYVYSEATVFERLASGQQPSTEEHRTPEMQGKVRKLEETLAAKK
jgi:hypothetical protein